jgi:hypothetical protein
VCRVVCPLSQDVPHDFVEALTISIRSKAYSPKDEIVPQGQYGKSLCIVLTGQVAICENGVKHRLIMCDDDEPVFGMSAVLDQTNFDASRVQVHSWSAEAISYCHVAELSHDSIAVALAATWPSGEERMHQIARQVCDVITSTPICLLSGHVTPCCKLALARLNTAVRPRSCGEGKASMLRTHWLTLVRPPRFG